jgi:methyl-accepting chemotaxis protein
MALASKLGVDQDQRAMAAADTLLLGVNAVNVLAAVAIGWQYGRTTQALGFGLAFLAVAVLVWALARGTLFARLGMATVAMCLVALQIHVGAGQNLYHFGVFVVLAILLVYRDWRVPVLAAALIAVQHALFNVLQQAGWGVFCFTEPSWGEVFAHAAYVIVQTAVEVYIAARLAYEARRDNELQQLLLDREGKVNLDVRDIVATTDLAGAVSATLKLMRETVARVRSSSESIRGASGRTARDSAELARRTSEQAGQLTEIASAVEQLAATVRQNSESARRAKTLTQSTSEIADRGGKAVREVAETMSAIAGSSKRISDIIGIIDGIAFQTNILALNAAVEAARAGEQGRGFAVVASEVRALAQRSAAAANETKALILDSNSKVDNGAHLVADAGLTMEEMLRAADQVTGLVSEIAVACAEQSRSIEGVNRAVGKMETTTHSNAQLVRECAAASEEMAAQAEDLSQAVSRFSLGSGKLAPTATTVIARAAGSKSYTPGVLPA